MAVCIPLEGEPRTEYRSSDPLPAPSPHAPPSPKHTLTHALCALKQVLKQQQLNVQSSKYAISCSRSIMLYYIYTIYYILYINKYTFCITFVDCLYLALKAFAAQIHCKCTNAVYAQYSMSIATAGLLNHIAGYMQNSVQPHQDY